MAKTTAEGEDSRQNEADQYRETLANSYAYVEGQKATQSFSALTPEDCYDRFIERISGKDTQARPNVLNRIAKIKAELAAAVDKIKAMPADAFRKPDANTDVNTEVAPLYDNTP